MHDTAAVVLVLMKQKDFAAARRTYLKVLESVPGHECTKVGPVEGWPILQYSHEDRTVEVCAAFVHLAPSLSKSSVPMPGDRHTGSAR